MADQTIKATEEMVGSGHPTKADTLNRLTLVEHNTDGTHKLVLTNLLTNSQWIAASGSTLENVGSAVYSDTDGSSYASWTVANCTMTDAGANLRITQTADTDQFARYALTGLTIGKLYELTIVTANGTGSWGASDYLRVMNNALAVEVARVATESAATFTLVWEAAETTNHAQIHASLGAGETLNVTSITCYEVTPGYVAADTLAPDTMTKTATLDIHQYWNAASANTYGYGTYNLKLTKGANTAEYLNFGTAINYRDCQGRPVTLGCYVYSLTANDNVKLSIHDGVSEIALSSGYVAANTLTWCEVTGTVAANASAITPRILCDGDTSDVCYISHPMLVFGSSIGEGNYQPIPNEIIFTQNAVRLENYIDAIAAGTRNVEAKSSGQVGKGIKAINLGLQGTCTSAGSSIAAYPAISGENSVGMYCQVNNVRCMTQGWISCDSSGDFYLGVTDTWNDVYVDVNAIQT